MKVKAPEPTSAAGQRGPADHERREQIIGAADQHFRHYGYEKTTVSDLAKAIGVSNAYIYRFFESKQAIGEAICAMTLGRIHQEFSTILTNGKSAAERLRMIYKCLVDKGLELFFNERKLHDIVVASVMGKWESSNTHKNAIYQALTTLITEGRAKGEFERKTPLDEVCLAVSETLLPFCHPILLEKKTREELDSAVAAVSNLVLRSLSP